MSLTMVTPWRPLRALGVHLPETFSEMRMHISTAPGGGVAAEIEFDDQDAAMARVHAPEITEQGRSLTGFFQLDIDFVAHENQVKGQMTLSSWASTFLLGIARNALCPAGFDGGTGSR